ncbi:DUF1361 domain-containing protein [Candidatus Peregrinibacteria bacterium]|nr:DUF1361 domain-containing protein [Candidatus Peregrinibacteria bacterium]
MEQILLTNINGYNIIMIVWNLFLAFIPCIIVYQMTKSIGKKKWKKLSKHKIAFILLFLIWLFFFPNTAYLFTIPRHLVNYCDNFDKFRVCLDKQMWIPVFFFTYAFIGVPTFYYSLNKMSQLFESVFGKLQAKLMRLIVIPLTTIAVMFGLYERFNTWDVIFRPLNILRIAGSYITDMRMIIDFIVITLFLYFIYLVIGFIKNNDY